MIQKIVKILLLIATVFILNSCTSKNGNDLKYSYEMIDDYTSILKKQTRIAKYVLTEEATADGMSSTVKGTLADAHNKIDNYKYFFDDAIKFDDNQRYISETLLEQYITDLQHEFDKVLNILSSKNFDSDSQKKLLAQLIQFEVFLDDYKNTFKGLSNKKFKNSFYQDLYIVKDEKILFELKINFKKSDYRIKGESLTQRNFSLERNYEIIFRKNNINDVVADIKSNVKIQNKAVITASKGPHDFIYINLFNQINDFDVTIHYYYENNQFKGWAFADYHGRSKLIGEVKK
ncbi:hypothetical protein PQO03_12485 [Lentisphaera profundi]|uniref:Lipoprotein n=1 Tax=Lentisphaera profundi TaxID=1658616 RepID=A0ABY7VZE8_9BACT|nr:hypothetical protein [Lentisphaera profundi]WDE98654.1 hypothetical protein PQO03_12485 [Lentisphaera profundi]